MSAPACSLGARQLVALSIAGDVVVFDWGKPHELGSAAFWVEAARRHIPESFRLGATFAEEVTACMLGGHGVPAAVGLGAFERVRARVDLGGRAQAGAIEAALSTPFPVPGRAEYGRYRFARQRAQRIAATLEQIAETELPTEPRPLRDWLLTCPGIGPKTASWIVRNWLDSDEVAVIDVHIYRAGIAAGFFLARWRLPRDYARLEQAFLTVAATGQIRPSVLDAYMWFELQQLGRNAAFVLGGAFTSASGRRMSTPIPFGT